MTLSDQQKQSLTESLRQAVERTFQSTAGSASTGRDRAQELVDEVLRRGGESARTASEVGNRIRDSIKDLRLATGDDIKRLQGALSSLEARLGKLEDSILAGKEKKDGP